MEKVKLNVLGISYSQTQTGAYALVLSEEAGKRRIPIIVGGFEAQSIAIHLEGLNPPRPLTHDLFLNFAKAFKITIREILIYKLEEGVFYSKLLCIANEETYSIDSRTSDAIALALRFGCPIYTLPEIIDKAGVILDFEKEDKKEENTTSEEKFSSSERPEKESQYKSDGLDDLQKKMDEAISKEDYEKASRIRDEINKRSKN
jgi:bifunctional DNase/RNase